MPIFFAYGREIVTVPLVPPEGIWRLRGAAVQVGQPVIGPMVTFPVIPGGMGWSSTIVQTTDPPAPRTAGRQVELKELGPRGITMFPVMVCPVPVMLNPTVMPVACARAIAATNASNNRFILMYRYPFFNRYPYCHDAPRSPAWRWINQDRVGLRVCCCREVYYLNRKVKAICYRR